MTNKQGFSLIEVIVALVILAVSVMGLQLVAANMLAQAGTAQLQLAASQLAEDRVDFIVLEPVYDSLPRYAATENALPNYPGFVRTTAISRTRDSTAAGITDFRRITVSVSAPRLRAPVVRTITIAAQ
jgi:prepilin-type N-terminal cleavage/methylation domain-containing protein